MNNSPSVSDNEISTSSMLNKETPKEKIDNIDVDYKEIKRNTPSDFDNWAECKKQAWLHLDDNPNSFFYRHVMPGEAKKTGPWSEDEKVLFIKALREHPPIKGHWGLFSRYIPARVGYQCNAFYKKLVASGEVEEIVPINKKNANSNNSNSNRNNNNNNNLPNNNINNTLPSNNNNNDINSISSNASDLNNHLNTPNNNIKKNSKITSGKKKAVVFEPSASRLQSIVSFLYISPKSSSLFDDFDISLINRRPISPILQTNKVIYDGSDYAYNNNIIQNQKNGFTSNSEINPQPSFHELLVKNLNDPLCEVKFDHFSDPYFKLV